MKPETRDALAGRRTATGIFIQERIRVGHSVTESYSPQCGDPRRLRAVEGAAIEALIRSLYARNTRNARTNERTDEPTNQQPTN